MARTRDRRGYDRETWEREREEEGKQRGEARGVLIQKAAIGKDSEQ